MTDQQTLRRHLKQARRSLGPEASALLVDQPRVLNLEDEATRISYSLGYQIGGDFKRQGVDLDDNPKDSKVSRTTLGEDSNDEIQLRSNNSFLHDNVD